MKPNKSFGTLKFFVMVIAPSFFLGAGGVPDAEGGCVDVAEAETGCVGVRAGGTDPTVPSGDGAVPACCSESMFDCEGAEII